MSQELNLFFRYPRDVCLSAILNGRVCHGNVPTKRNILALEHRDPYEFRQRAAGLPEPLAPGGKHWQICSTLTCDTLCKHTHQPGRVRRLSLPSEFVRIQSETGLVCLFLS